MDGMRFNPRFTSAGVSGTSTRFGESGYDLPFDYSRADSGPAIGGTEALKSVMGRQVPIPDIQGDPFWGEMESLLQDRLGDMLDMDVQMPIKLPNMEDPKDQVRFLMELKKRGFDSQDVAMLMGKQGMGAGGEAGMKFSDALGLMKFMYQQQKDNLTQAMTIIPHIADPATQTEMVKRVMDQLVGGKGMMEIFETGFPGFKEPVVRPVSPESVKQSQGFKQLQDAYSGTLEDLMVKSKKSGDRSELDTFEDNLREVIKSNYGWPDPVIEKAMEEIWNTAYAKSIGRR